MADLKKKTNGAMTARCSGCSCTPFRKHAPDPEPENIRSRPQAPSYKDIQVSWGEADNQALIECYCSAVDSYVEDRRFSQAAETCLLASSLEPADSLSSAISRARLLKRAADLFIEAGEYDKIQGALEGCSRAYCAAASLVGEDQELRSIFLIQAARIQLSLYDFPEASCMFAQASEGFSDDLRAEILIAASALLSNLPPGDGMVLENHKIHLLTDADQFAHRGAPSEAAHMYLVIAELESDPRSKASLLKKAGSCLYSSGEHDLSREAFREAWRIEPDAGRKEILHKLINADENGQE